MGYIFNFKDAQAYDRWYRDPRNQTTIDLQSRLMLEMLAPCTGQSLLDIGCGTGLSLMPFKEAGLQLTGIDPSPYMLDIARENLKSKADLHRAFAEDLPFDDNSFEYAILNTTLEFVENPQKALEEACRVAKDKLFLGILNRYAIKGIQRRVKGIFNHSIYNRARFFSVWEVKHLMRGIMGDVPLAWRTACQFPSPTGILASRIERLGLVQRCPFGAFVGMVITLEPRYRSTPLKLKYHCEEPGAASG
jgi:SAM-dependent methyltransferase